VIYPSIENLHGARKNILLGVKKLKISLQSQNPEFGAQNQYDRVLYPSIGNFTCSKKKYTIQGRKSENKLPEPIKQNLGPKTSKINPRTKNIKTSRHFKKCMLKKFCPAQKKQATNLRVLVDFKRKKMCCVSAIELPMKMNKAK
jgi:hypothetical protein